MAKNSKRKNKNPDRKKKIALVFDEAKRKDFLCGFRKRKLERKKKAQEEMQRMLKDEVKRIKQENKESYKKLVVSSRPIPDIEQLLQDEYEDEDVNVKIVEIASDTLQKRDLVIGENKPKEPIQTKKKHKTDRAPKSNEIPGMGLGEENDVEESEDEQNDDNDDEMKTKKEIKQMLKKQATKKIQKSKVFQMKSKLDRVKNKKKSQQKKGAMNRTDPRSRQKKGNNNHNGKTDPKTEKRNKKKKVDRRKHH